MPRYTVENTVMMGRQCNVFCNKEPLDEVVEVDTDLGFAVVHDKSAPSYQRLVLGRMTVLITDRKTGEVLRRE